MITTIPGGSRYAAIQNLAQHGIEGAPGLSSAFRYAKIRGNGLFFVFSHPLAKTEFKHQKEDILARLRGHYRANLWKMKQEGIIFNAIHALVIHAPKEQPAPHQKEIAYRERSTGEFAIDAKDPDIAAFFRRIKTTIQERQP